METTNLSLGKYIRQLREAKRLSLTELSTRSGVAYAHMSRIENESTIPNPDTIVKICDVIDGDLTVMLQKAKNLPRVILDRLMERDAAVRLQTLHRAIEAVPDDSGDADGPLERAIEHANLDSQSVSELRSAIEGLISLRPHARHAVTQLIQILRDDEGDGAPG
jgi:transcriptional regulator with XRE-family HTH domain